MTRKIISFLIGLLLLSVLIWITAWFGVHRLNTLWYTNLLPFMLGFFYIMNAAFFIIFSYINNAPIKVFIKKFLLLFLVKFLIYFTTIIVVLVFFKSDAITIALTAMIVYTIFAIYELSWMLTMIKRKNNNK